MIARNRRTGSRILGTAEELHARANTDPGLFKRNSDGDLEYEHEGYTEVFWNGQKTATRQDETVFLDENGEDVVASDVEMVNDLNEGLTPVEAQPPISEWPDLEEIGRETNFCDRVSTVIRNRVNLNRWSTTTSWGSGVGHRQTRASLDGVRGAGVKAVSPAKAGAERSDAP